MTSAHIKVLRYMYAGLRLNENGVIAPNGNIVQRVRYQTLRELLTRRWIEADPTRDTYFRLTAAGRDRALVKQRVEDFLIDLTNHPTT